MRMNVSRMSIRPVVHLRLFLLAVGADAVEGCFEVVEDHGVAEAFENEGELRRRKMAHVSFISRLPERTIMTKEVQGRVTYLPVWLDADGKRHVVERTDDTAGVNDNEDYGETHGR